MDAGVNRAARFIQERALCLPAASFPLGKVRADSSERPGLHQPPPAPAPCGAHPLVLVCTEETGVMPFLDDDVGDARLVILFQFDAGVSDG